MKIAYKIFHIDGSSELRDKLFLDASEYLDSKLDIFQSPTINLMINNAAQDFIENNDGFNPTFNFKIGEVGVWASNFVAWNNLLKSDYDALLLFEDDLLLSENFYEKLIELINDLPDNWDFFSVFCHPNQIGRYHKDFDITDKIVSGYQDWSMLCYMVSRQGAQKALNFMKNGFSQPIDWFIFRNQHEFNVYTIHPSQGNIVALVNLPTTIQEIESRIEI